MMGFAGFVAALAAEATLLVVAAAPPRPVQEAPAAAVAPVAPVDRGAFPASWVGVWRGPATSTNRSGGGGFAFDVELRIAPTAKPDRFQWTIVYESNEMRRQERPYELLVKDAGKGLYAIDEKNGIVIDAWFLDGALYSHFVVEGNRISVIERLSTGPSGEEEIVFELVTVADEDLRESGGEGGVPAVRSAAPRSAQRSVLKRIEPRLAASFDGHEGPVHGLAVSASGDRIVSAGDDGSVRLWDATDNRCLFVASKAHESPIWAVAFLPSGRIVSGGQDGLLKTWDGETGAPIDSLGTASNANGITTLARSHDGRLVATGGFDSTVRVWDLERRAEIRTFQGHADTVWTVSFAPDAKRVFSGSFDGTVRVWDVDSGAAVATWTEENPELRGWKRAMALSPPDGRTALLGGAPSPREWDVSTGKLMAEFDGAHDGSILALAVAPDGKRFATGGFDVFIHLWDRASRKSFRRWNAGQGEAVWALEFLRDGRLVSAGASGTIRVWDAVR